MLVVYIPLWYACTFFLTYRLRLALNGRFFFLLPTQNHEHEQHLCMERLVADLSVASLLRLVTGFPPPGYRAVRSQKHLLVDFICQPCGHGSAVATTNKVSIGFRHSA